MPSYFAITSGFTTRDSDSSLYPFHLNKEKIWHIAIILFQAWLWSAEKFAVMEMYQYWVRQYFMATSPLRNEMCPGTFSGTEDKCKRSSCSMSLNFFIPCTDHKLPAGIVPFLWNSCTGGQLMDSHRVGYQFSYTGRHLHSLLCSLIRDHGAHVVTLSN